MRALVAALLILSATSALGAQSGTVSGTVTVLSSRPNPYDSAGYESARPPRARQVIPLNRNTVLPLKEAQVLVRITDGTQVLGNFFTRTNASGQYTVPWFIQSNGLSMDVTVFLARPNLNEGQVVGNTPTASFQIEDDVILGTSSFQSFTGARTANFFLNEQSVHVAAYQSAVEVYALFDNQGNPPSGGSIRADTSSVVIEIGTFPSFIFDTNFAPTNRAVFLKPDSAFSGRTVAHELGHILDWNSLDLPLAAIFPADYSCIFPGLPDANPSWRALSRECQKAAFHDGFADFVSAAWMWYRDASGTEPGSGRSIPRISVSSGDLLLEGNAACGSTSSENVPFCATTALWDIFDNPPSDDDGIQNRDLSDIVGAMRAYPRNCAACFADNHCSIEGWPHNQVCGPSELDANNWKDFAFNYKASIGQSTAINAITAANGLSDQVD